MGTPLAITDVNGDLVWRVEYKPFGDLYDQSVSKVVNNLRFSGQYHDAESSLYQNWYRYYSPRLGRYMEPDPIGILSDTNVYRYAWDNPITYGDSTGLAACKKECGVRTPPKYDHSGVIPDFTVFTFTASFLNDSKHDPTCCEVRQYIQWNRTLAPDGALFKPPDDKPYTWYEDRGASDKRYGHRTGLHSAPSPIDRYRGDDYFGLDQPQSFPPGFVTKFRLAVVDVCNGGRWVWAGPPALTVYGSGN